VPPPRVQVQEEEVQVQEEEVQVQAEEVQVQAEEVPPQEGVEELQGLEVFGWAPHMLEVQE